MDLVFAPSQIETWPIARLRPYARNAKMHGQDQVAKIAASMARFGWTMPCMVADDGELIAGHGRVLAATMLGLTEVPVIRLSHLDEAERRAYRIADNKLTELGEWNEAILRDEIAVLLADDFDATLLGFSDDDLDALPGFELRVKRHQCPVDLGAAAAMAEIRMHAIGEVDRCRATRQVDHSALRRHHVDRLVERGFLVVLDPLGRIGDFVLPRQ